MSEQLKAFLTAKDICGELGISMATLYRWMGRGVFPRPERIGLNSNRWRRGVIDGYMADPEGWRRQHSSAA